MGDKVVTIGSQPTYELLDEDAMGSNSDKAVPTQQSVKAYVDSSLGIGGITATAGEINKLAGVTAGTASASKAVVLGANKNIDTLVIAASGLKIGSGAGTAVTATAAELNKLSGAGSAVASGTQHAHVTDGKTDYSTGDLDSEDEIITAINTLNGKINSILAALEAFGINASS